MAKVIDVAQVTYEAPDLDLMERFLTDFGLSRAARTDEALYMRGAGHQHHIYVTRKGPQARFIGATFEVESGQDLEALAAIEGVPVEPSREPGGGYQVVMYMPDGFEIRAIWGRERVEPLAQRDRHRFNAARSKERVNASIRVRSEPCQAIRLGHFVLHVSSHDESVRWLHERFNLLPSDYFLPPGEDGPVVGTFLRLDRGSELVDHHCLLVLQSDWVGVHHCSFEVEDLDAVMCAHDYLLQQGWTLDVGVGRHLLGSQIFDYWKDPNGFRIEHYTDGDVCDASFQPSTFNGTADQTTQWGMEPPKDFFE